MLLVAVQTGLWASELMNLRCGDVQFEGGNVQRCADAAAGRTWLEELHGDPESPVFPSQRGGTLSHDGLSYLPAKHLVVARKTCPPCKTSELRRMSSATLLPWNCCKTVTTAS